MYNTSKTLSLSKEIPDSGYSDVKKLNVLDVAIVAKDLDDSIDNLSDIAVAVTFSGKIVAENLEGISVDTKVNGIEGIDVVTFKGARTINGNTIVFVCEQDIECTSSNILIVSLEDAVIKIAEGSSVYDVNGNTVVLVLPDTKAEFLCEGNTPVVPEEPSEPDEEPTTSENPSEETTDDTESTTVPSETTTETTTELTTESTTEKAETTTTSSDKAPVTDNTPGTGDTPYVICSAVAVILGLAVLLVVKKREDK